MTINKKTFSRLKSSVEKFGDYLLIFILPNKMQVIKVLELTNYNYPVTQYVYKTLGSSVIYSPMTSPPRYIYYIYLDSHICLIIHNVWFFKL